MAPISRYFMRMSFAILLVTRVKVVLRRGWQLSAFRACSTENFTGSFHLPSAMEVKIFLPELKAARLATIFFLGFFFLLLSPSRPYDQLLWTLGRPSLVSQLPSCNASTPAAAWLRRDNTPTRSNTQAVASSSECTSTSRRKNHQNHASPFSACRIAFPKRGMLLHTSLLSWPPPHSEGHINPTCAQVAVWNERQQTSTNVIFHSLLEGRSMAQGLCGGDDFLW